MKTITVLPTNGPIAAWIGAAILLLAPVVHAQVDDFNPGANDCVRGLAIQTDGKILVGGWFTVLGGQTRNHIGRLNTDGSLDTSFNPSADTDVNDFIVQTDGKIVVAGEFHSLGGQTRMHIGRLNANGSLDNAFNPAANYSISAMALQADGKIVVAGGYWRLPNGRAPEIGRLNPDGMLDTNFTPPTKDGGYVTSLAVQPDGKILVGGYFTNMDAQPRIGIARLNANGSLDTTFIASLSSEGVAEVALQADGKIIVGGFFQWPRKYLVRLNVNGDVDYTFNRTVTWPPYCMAVLANGWTMADQGGYSDSNFGTVAVQPDGKYVIGGFFTTWSGQPRARLARVKNSTLVTQSVDLAGSTVTWMRNGPIAEAWRSTFDVSSDGLNWSLLGAGVRVPGGWQLGGVAAPARSWIRCRGFVCSSGMGYSSSYIAETIAGPIVVLSQPVSQTNDPGTTASFSLGSLGVGPLSYRWFKGSLALSDSATISGSGGATLTVSNVLGGDSGDYWVIASNAFGSVTSSIASLFVRDPIIKTQPADVAAYAGQDAVLAVDARGTSPFLYQWRHEGTSITGATNSALNLTNVQAQSAGAYDVAVTNSLGVLVSRTATLVVRQVITNQPQSQVVRAGDNASFRVGAVGPQPLTYQWQFNGTNITNATAAVLSLTNVQALLAGPYRVRVGYSGGSTLTAC